VVLSQNKDAELLLSLPGNLLRQQNILKFKLPDAASPELLQLSTDQRLLGFAVYWIQFDRKAQHELAGRGKNQTAKPTQAA